MKIADMPISEKPLERLQIKGVHSLSDKELIAIVLNSGGKNESVLQLSENILHKFGSLKNIFEQTIGNLSQIKNISSTKAARLHAISEISKRIHFSQTKPSILIKTPTDAFSYIRCEVPIDYKQENLVLLSINSRGNLIASDILFKGTLNVSFFNPREIFQKAFERNAFQIVIAHNHPSKDLAPSSQDLLATEKIANAGAILGINVLDHLIFCRDSFASMKSLGLFSVANFSKGGEKSENEVYQK